MNNIPINYPTPEDDATGLRVDVGFKEGSVMVQFSKPVLQMALRPEHTRSLAIALLQNAEMALANQNSGPQLPPSRMG